MKIAIIGAGLAGLTLAQRLSGAHNVTAFEKARGPGGRMSTRRATPFAFDHGAQYFTAESAPFRAFLEPFVEAGIVRRWPEQIRLEHGAKVSEKSKFTAAPGMNSLCKSMAADLNVRSGCRIETLERRGEQWDLIDAAGEKLGPFDWVLSTAPAPQTTTLFPDAFNGAERLAGVKMQGCFALMLGFEAPLDLSWSAMKPGEPPIGWIAVNSEKPARNSAYSLLIQSSNAWAEAHLEDDPDGVTSMLMEAASQLIGADLASASHQVLHRWRYAATITPLGEPFLIDRSLQIAACGDWCLGSKVEAAYLSAVALAEAI